MLRPFSILNTDPNEPEGRNWRIFDENSKTIVRNDLTFTSGVATPTIPYAYFTLYGPIVYFELDIRLDTNDGWTTGSSISMPFQPSNNQGAITNYPLAQVYVGNTGAAITTAYFLTSSLLFFTGAYTYTGAGTQLVRVQGWYYRN